MDIFSLGDLTAACLLALAAALRSQQAVVRFSGAFFLALIYGCLPTLSRSLLLGQSLNLLDFNLIYASAFGAISGLFLSRIKKIPDNLFSLLDGCALCLTSGLACLHACIWNWHPAIAILLALICALMPSSFRDLALGDSLQFIEENFLATAIAMSAILFLLLYRLGQGLEVSLAVAVFTACFLRVQAIIRQK